MIYIIWITALTVHILASNSESYLKPPQKMDSFKNTEGVSWYISIDNTSSRLKYLVCMFYSAWVSTCKLGTWADLKMIS